MPLIPKSGSYRGRLACHPDSNFYTDSEGRKVVTEDFGLTWRYAKKGDTSHVHRYERRVLTVDTTANQEVPEPHHYAVAGNDPHANGLVFTPDAEAATETSHTEAYKNG